MRIYIFLSLLSFLFCQSPKLGENKLNLENLDLDINIEKFYSKEIEKAKIFQCQKDKNLNGKKEKEFSGKLLNFRDFHSISIDSIYKDETLLGIQYNMTTWSSRDSLAYFNKMYFHKIEMMKSPKGDFMALVSSNESSGTKNFEDLLQYLTNKNGNPKIMENNFFGSYFVYSWLEKDRLIAIITKLDNKENTLKLGIEIDKENMKFDTIKKPTNVTKLFIVNKQYIDSIKGKLHRGDWLYLK